MVVIARLALFTLSVIAFSGCYLSHRLPTDAQTDASVHDSATRDSALRDSALRDGAMLDTLVPFDAGTVLPPEPDPDLGPDAAPSDYVDAGTWQDPPLPSTDPCCVLGDPVRVTSRDEGTVLDQEPPLIAWGPGVWGLLVTRMMAPPDWHISVDPLVFQLNPDGTPMGAARLLDHPGHGQVLRYAEGRWAVAIWVPEALGGSLPNTMVRLFDREWHPTSAWLSLGPSSWHDGADLARLTHSDRWLGLLIPGSSTVAAIPFHEVGVEPGVEHPLPLGSYYIHATGLRSRVATVTSGSGEYPVDEVQVIGAPPELPLLARFPLAGASNLRAISSLRDQVIVAGAVGTEVQIDVVDPFAFEHVAGPIHIGMTNNASETDFLDIAGSDKLGVAGVCYGVGPVMGSRDSPRSLRFRLVGPDGQPRGAAVQIVDSYFRSGLVNCTVGSDDQGFLVGWWDGSALWVRRVDLAP